MAITTCVVYYHVPMHPGHDKGLQAHQAIAQQEKQLQTFLALHPEFTIIKTFIETEHHRARQHWLQLKEAIAYCHQYGAHLIIAQIGNVIQNEAFSSVVLSLFSTPTPFVGTLYCADQPHINSENFRAICTHAQEQKRAHGQLIRAGLYRTSARSGNPNALEMIRKVNKPKIENAIIFAVLLQPVIHAYQARGLSQRKMVDALNAEGFTAPEGGHWVLSQLQKVLERMKLNEIAFTLATTFQTHRAQGLDPSASAEKLTTEGTLHPLGEAWTADSVLKIEERIARLEDIIKFYTLTIRLSPIIEKYRIDELTETILLNELKEHDIPLAFSERSH